MVVIKWALIFPGLLRLWPAVILEDWTDLGPTVVWTKDHDGW